MKTVHINKNETKSLTEWLTLAKEKEQEEEFDDAIDAYGHLIKEHPKKEYAYQRLMMLYRKQKEYKKELKVVETALQNFKYVLGNPSAKKQNKKINQLSMRLMKSTGLVDKKDNPAFLPEPLQKWTKRKLALEKLIAKKSK